MRLSLVSEGKKKRCHSINPQWNTNLEPSSCTKQDCGSKCEYDLHIGDQTAPCVLRCLSYVVYKYLVYVNEFKPLFLVCV